MEMFKFVPIVWIYMIICLSAVHVYGLTCTCGNIQEGQDVECQCDTVNAIQWFKRGTSLTTCVDATCIPNPGPDYTFSHTGSSYVITMSSFSFTNCKVYQAKDLKTGAIDTFPYCPGRPQPYGNIAYMVYSAQGNTATLRLDSLAYPTVSTVVWKKDETELENNTKLTMTIDFVKSNDGYIDIVQLELLILNVNVSDYGQYNVQMRNDVGTMEKTFILIGEEISDSSGVNIGMIVGVVVGSIVLAGLIVSAVVFLLRRHSTTTGRERGTGTSAHQSNDREEPTNIQSNSEAMYEGGVTNYEMLNKQNQDVTTYSSISDSIDPPKDCSSGEEKAYENCE